MALNLEQVQQRLLDLCGQEAQLEAKRKQHLAKANQYKKDINHLRFRPNGLIDTAIQKLKLLYPPTDPRYASKYDADGKIKKGSQFPSYDVEIKPYLGIVRDTFTKYVKIFYETDLRNAVSKLNRDERMSMSIAKNNLKKRTADQSKDTYKRLKTVGKSLMNVPLHILHQPDGEDAWELGLQYQRVADALFALREQE